MFYFSSKGSMELNRKRTCFWLTFLCLIQFTFSVTILTKNIYSRDLENTTSVSVPTTDIASTEEVDIIRGGSTEDFDSAAVDGNDAISAWGSSQHAVDDSVAHFNAKLGTYQITPEIPHITKMKRKRVFGVTNTSDRDKRDAVITVPYTTANINDLPDGYESINRQGLLLPDPIQQQALLLQQQAAAQALLQQQVAHQYAPNAYRELYIIRKLPYLEDYRYDSDSDDTDSDDFDSYEFYNGRYPYGQRYRRPPRPPSIFQSLFPFHRLGKRSTGVDSNSTTASVPINKNATTPSEQTENQTSESEDEVRSRSRVGHFALKHCPEAKEDCEEKVSKNSEDFPDTSFEAELDSPMDCRCGVQSVRVETLRDGTTVRIMNNPWLVEIMTHRSHLCSGSIISDRHILTSKRCVEGKESLMIVTGRNAGMLTMFNVSDMVIHPDNDVGLLKIDGQIDPDVSKRPICLPTEESDIHSVSTGYLISWLNKHRAPLQVLHTEVPILAPDECNSKLSDAEFCTGSPATSFCGNDTGGILQLYKRPYSYTQIGVVGESMGCRKKKTQGVYTDLNKVNSWIKENTAGARYCKS